MAYKKYYSSKHDMNNLGDNWNCLDCHHYWYPEERSNNRIRFCIYKKPRIQLNKRVNVRVTHPEWCPLEKKP